MRRGTITKTRDHCKSECIYKSVVYGSYEDISYRKVEIQIAPSSLLSSLVPHQMGLRCSVVLNGTEIDVELLHLGLVSIQ